MIYCFAMENLSQIKIDPQKLKAARGDRGLTEVARIVGISKQQLWNYENGLSELPAATIAKLCLLYRVPIEQLTNATKNFLGKEYIAA